MCLLFRNNHKNRDKHIFFAKHLSALIFLMALGFRRRSKGDVVEVAALSGPRCLCQQQTLAGLHRAGRGEQNHNEAGSSQMNRSIILQTEKHLEGNYFHFHITLVVSF